jgi:choline dehydrogenase-like flavoprotein
MHSFDYIVVGGGTAGCVIAARLTENDSTRVLLLEAGAAEPLDAMAVPQAWPTLLASPANWGDVTVKQAGTGTAAPLARGRALGGSSAINAMGFVRGHRSSYDAWVAAGAEGWGFDDLLPYFQRSENAPGRDPRVRGIGGPLTVGPANPPNPVIAACLEAASEQGHGLAADISGGLEVGFGLLDLNIVGGRRQSAADAYLRPVLARRNLQVVPDALVHRLHIAGDRCTGVMYSTGQDLISASCSGEVILAAGSIGSAQLLMLSGIGPPDMLQRYGIQVRVALPGVGANLQDRYEIGVVNRMKFPEWDAYLGATFSTGDAQFAEWKSRGAGMYATNGAVLTLFRRSSGAAELPDLFCMSLLAPFRGYFPNYSRLFSEHLNYLTWVVLKAHTRNSAGRVTLRSSDPRDTPSIDFNYFQQGGEEDLDAVIDGIRFVRRLTAGLKREGLIEKEELPGDLSEKELRDFVRCNCWGHHASCTCAIGPWEQNGVLTSDFRVHHTLGLRVVDASVFPRIPGFFIASSIYMIGEKAADAILADARRRTNGG